MSSHGAQEFLKLIATAEPAHLGPKRRAGTLEPRELNRILEEFFSANEIASSIQPQLRSAALLWHDHLEESHGISQAIETREGSWLHGMMHRREPDFGNAKYWFRRVGQHDAFATVGEQAARRLQHDGRGLTERLIENGEWMPLSFVDECQRVKEGAGGEDFLLREIQEIEFKVLVTHIMAN